MRTLQAGALFLAVSSLATAAPAGDSWRQKPYTTWNQQDVDQVLENSPWAHRLKLIVALEQVDTPIPAMLHSYGDGISDSIAPPPVPVSSVAMPAANSNTRAGPRNSPDDRPALNEQRAAEVSPPAENGVPGVAVVRWASARTVREAEARNRALHGTVLERYVSEGARILPPDSYIVYVDLRIHLNDVSRVPGGGVLTPAMVRHSILLVKSNGERVGPLAVRTAPLPKFDERKELALAAFYVYFPRKQDGKPVIPGDGSQVRFVCPLSPVPIHADFDLRKMGRAGSPDL